MGARSAWEGADTLIPMYEDQFDDFKAQRRARLFTIEYPIG